jgi:hypothetical protein
MERGDEARNDIFDYSEMFYNIRWVPVSEQMSPTGI